MSVAENWLHMVSVADARQKAKAILGFWIFVGKIDLIDSSCG